jgi:hypothetical protein
LARKAYLEDVKYIRTVNKSTESKPKDSMPNICVGLDRNINMETQVQQTQNAIVNPGIVMPQASANSILGFIGNPEYKTYIEIKDATSLNMAKILLASMEDKLNKQNKTPNVSAAPQDVTKEEKLDKKAIEG